MKDEFIRKSIMDAHSLSPSPLSLLKVTSQHITIILPCTFQPAHPPETGLTSLGEITSHPQGVCTQDSKHQDGSNTRTTSNTSSSPPPDFCLFPFSQYPVAAAAAKSLQSCLTLCNPIDGSTPGSPVPGILQARTLEWVAISFSNA